MQVCYLPCDFCVHIQLQGFTNFIVCVVSTVILDREKSVVSTTKRYTKPQGYIDQWMCVMSTGAKNRFVILGNFAVEAKFVRTSD